MPKVITFDEIHEHNGGTLYCLTRNSLDSSGTHSLDTWQQHPDYTDPPWRQREAHRTVTQPSLRLADELFAPLVDAGLIESTREMTVAPYFFRRSAINDQLIVYTPNAEYGEQDRQIRTRLGRALKALFPTISDEIVRDCCDRFRSNYGSIQLRFTRDPDKIREVYQCSPACMSHHLDDFRGDQYPTDVYTTEDVAVAYAVNGDRITARTVVNEIDKRWVRIYGDEAVLSALLREAGYSRGDLGGCRIARIPYSGTYIAPYVDGDAHYANEDGDYLILSEHGEYCLTRTDGLASEPLPACDSCGDHDQSHYMTVVEGRAYCGACRESELRQHDLYGWYNPETAIEVLINRNGTLERETLPGRFENDYYAYDGELYAQDALYLANLALCPYRGQVIDRDQHQWSNYHSRFIKNENAQRAIVHGQDDWLMLQSDASVPFFPVGDILYHADDLADALNQGRLTITEPTETAAIAAEG